VNRYVSERLRQLRLERGLSQRQAATLLTRISDVHWTAQAISRAETGQGTYIRRWSVDDLYMLTAAFDVPVSYFLPDERPGPRSPDPSRADAGQPGATTRSPARPVPEASSAS
jgi:transcriptional regulator with XRE-family HTH domain